MANLNDSKWELGTFILIDKPIGWTSFDVVKKVRNAIQTKVGHAGTLDPLATGLLILATGKYTKKINEIQNLNKVYVGEIELGKTTPSYDLETPFDSTQSTERITKEGVEWAIKSFVGNIMQKPPPFSAVKVQGKRAYSQARKNEPLMLKSRPVTIYKFEINKWQNPILSFTIACSKGTYIRSIAHELGQKLGVGGYLKSLKRIKIGDFMIEDAQQIEAFSLQKL